MVRLTIIVVCQYIVIILSHYKSLLSTTTDGQSIIMQSSMIMPHVAPYQLPTDNSHDTSLNQQVILHRLRPIHSGLTPTSQHLGRPTMKVQSAAPMGGANGCACGLSNGDLPNHSGIRSDQS